MIRILEPGGRLLCRRNRSSAVRNLDLRYLRTNVGADWQSNQLGGTPTGAAKFCALTANATAPAATDTTLTGEIVTAGLARKAASFGHTVGATTYTESVTYTAVAADVAGGAVNINKCAWFDAASTGNMAFEDTISPAAQISNAGDQLTITQTVSI